MFELLSVSGAALWGLKHLMNHLLVGTSDINAVGNCFGEKIHLIYGIHKIQSLCNSYEMFLQHFISMLCLNINCIRWHSNSS
jgi:hypothetical protein